MAPKPSEKTGEAKEEHPRGERIRVPAAEADYSATYRARAVERKTPEYALLTKEEKKIREEEIKEEVAQVRIANGRYKTCKEQGIKPKPIVRKARANKANPEVPKVVQPVDTGPSRRFAPSLAEDAASAYLPLHLRVPNREVLRAAPGPINGIPIDPALLMATGAPALSNPTLVDEFSSLAYADADLYSWED